MEYVVFIIIVLVIFYFIGNSGSSTSTKKTIAIKNYVQPKTKYSLQEAREIIEIFAKDLGFSEKETISESFQGILYECRNEYKKEIKDIEKEISSTKVHWDKTIRKIEDELLKQDLIQMMKRCKRKQTKK